MVKRQLQHQQPSFTYRRGRFLRFLCSQYISDKYICDVRRTLYEINQDYLK